MLAQRRQSVVTGREARVLVVSYHFLDSLQILPSLTVSWVG